MSDNKKTWRPAFVETDEGFVSTRDMTFEEAERVRMQIQRSADEAEEEVAAFERACVERWGPNWDKEEEA